MDLVFSFAKRMTVLVNGAVLTEGDPVQIANDPQVKAVYLGHGDSPSDPPSHPHTASTPSQELSHG